jgi:LAS superfamily LD-carboxypeptidase LdcB
MERRNHMTVMLPSRIPRRVCMVHRLGHNRGMRRTALPHRLPPEGYSPLACVGLEVPPLVEVAPARGTRPAQRCHAAVLPAWQALAAGAARAGIELVAVSSHRSFAVQEAIWNAKWRGERAVLDRRGRPVDMTSLRPAGRMAAILAWSALPGASRHHWGTEFDVIDGAAIPDGYRVQLVPEEYAAGGPFARLAAWLDGNLARYGFHRPYRTDRGGVAPEPWHLSCTAVATLASRRLRLAHLRQAIEDSRMAGRDVVLARLPALYERYVRRVDRPR